MIREFVSLSGRLRPAEAAAGPSAMSVWIDLLSPTTDEEAELERCLGINIPTREEMEEIEISSRLYTDNGASFMTATLPAQADGDDPEMAPVTFVLSGNRLITIRYHEPRAFRTFPLRAEKTPMGCETGEGVLIALLETVVDRVADILERAGRDVDGISRDVFQRSGAQSASRRDYRKMLESIGRKGDLLSKMRDSLVTLERLIGFLGHRTLQRGSSKDTRDGVKTLSRDVRSLEDHADFLTQQVMFLLDATLGMISIEQNAIIKIFSVAAVAFLPPTLIASIYGMNFEFMPELAWPMGYPIALGLMVLSAVLPLTYFKRRGWL